MVDYFFTSSEALQWQFWKGHKKMCEDIYASTITLIIHLQVIFCAVTLLQQAKQVTSKLLQVLQI